VSKKLGEVGGPWFIFNSLRNLCVLCVSALLLQGETGNLRVAEDAKVAQRKLN
jgi:hypothetical protein